jgi:2-haloacid dehalogenase
LAERSLDYAIAVVGGVPSGVREALLATYRHMPPFPEVPATLARLNGNGSTCAILTNGDQAMIDTVVAASGLSPAFKALLSVEDAGIFKPARRVYQLVLDRFAGTPGDVTFVSSNRWDIAGAHVFGFQTVWLNRSGLPDEYPDMPAGRILADLSQLG